MYCEGCGKKLIRGYQFCIECGMPVPPEADENAEQTAVEGAENGAENTADNGSVSMPDIQPISGEGSLVFCSTCGMHMQKSTTVCEKCGKPLGNSGMNNSGSMPNGGVPLFNSDPLGGDDFSGMSEGEIDQINSFMNGGGLAPLEGMNGMRGFDGGLAAVSTTSSGDMGSIGGADDLDSLAQQLASFGASTSEMPAIGVAPAPTQMRQAEPKPGEAREVQDFAMDISSDIEELAGSDVPVIDGGSMDENPAEDVNLDPYSFVNNVISPEPAPTFEPAPVSEEPAAAQHTEYFGSAPAFEPAPAVEEVAPVVESAPTFEPAPAVEEVAPVIESAPVFEPAPAVEEVAPVIESAPAFEPAPAVEEVAPVIESAPAFEPAPAVEEVAPVIESAPVFEPAPAVEEAPFIEETAPFIEEGAPVIAEGGMFAEQPAPTPAPAPEPAPAPLPRPAKKVEEIDPALGKLSYCRNCGQDMYEKEPVCKNCGAPYKPPVQHDKTLDKKFGSVPADEKTGIKKYLPFILGVSAVAAVIIILIVATPNNHKPNTSSLTGNETLNVSTTTPAATTPAPEDTPAPADTSNNDAQVVVPVESAESVHEVAIPTMESEETTPTAPEKPETGDAAESTPATHKTAPHTTGGAPEGTTKPTTTTKPNTTTKATTTARTTPKTTTTKAAAGITSPKTTSLEKDRDVIMDAVAVISGEVGKIDTLAQNIIYAMENSTGNAETARTAYMNRDFAKNVLSSLESGKSAVDSAVNKAKPKNSELNSMYDSLVSLQKKYTAYYNFIKSPSGSTSKFTSSCSTYMSDFTSGVNGFKYTKFTSDYTSAETNAAYKAAMSDAVTAVNNAVSAFSTLQTKVSSVDKSTFDTAAVQELSKSANSKTLANAVAYAQEVQAYRIMLASAPSSYSSAYNDLKSASDELNALVDLYNNIQENSLSSYKNESSSCISNASSAAKSVTSAIS